MNESLPPDEDWPDESLADVPPIPIVEDEALSGSRFGTVVVRSLAGMGALYLIGMLMTPTMGATRSSKLKWEQRQQEIEEAERDAQHESDANR